MKNHIKIAFAHSENGHNETGIGAGLTQYLRKKGHWQLIAWPDSSFESLVFLKQQGCRGAIVNIQTSAKARQLREVAIPIIAYSTLQDMGDLPFISSDSRQVAQLAFEYLAGKQFRHFAFFGLTEARWSKERLDHFSEFVSRAGYTLHSFKTKPIPIVNNLTSFPKLWIDATLKRGQQELIDWLRQLPKPVAILASCDMLGCHVSLFAEEAGLSIPDEAAILGIDNNEALCNICSVPMSSIVLNLQKAGYEAAGLLDRIIAGKARMEGQQIKVLPIHVKERASTSVFAIEDEEVLAALRYIESHSRQPLQVEDVARQICVSKRLLQKKFQQFLKRSIHEEITHAHFRNARLMLLETDLSIEDIAFKSGFCSTAKMRRAFLEIAGSLPHTYRQMNRPL
jgi:LacI family transcriptional regulator